MGTFSGDNSVIFSVSIHINWGHHIRQRIGFHRRNCIHLRVEPILERLLPRDKQTESYENYVHLTTWWKKMVQPYTVNNHNTCFIFWPELGLPSKAHSSHTKTELLQKAFTEKMSKRTKHRYIKETGLNNNAFGFRQCN